MSCVVAPVTGLCGQRAVTLNADKWSELAPVAPVRVDFSCDRDRDPAGCRKQEADERAFQEAATARRNAGLTNVRQALMLDQFKQVVGFPRRPDSGPFMAWPNPWLDVSGRLKLRPEEIKAIDDAYTPRNR